MSIKCPDRPPVIVIIGSSRFKAQHLGYAQKFTLQGKVVLLAGFWHHVDNVPITSAQKVALDDLAMRKIDLAGAVFVVNVNGYVGESTKKLVAYAKECDKPILYADTTSEALVTLLASDGDGDRSAP